MRDPGGDRCGDNWFRGAHLFLEFLQDGADQVDAYLKAIEDAGGWGWGDILPIVDVELGNPGKTAADGTQLPTPHPNRAAGKRQLIDCVTACAERIRQQTDRDPAWPRRDA